MKKLIIVLAFLSFLFSCDTEEKKYLYDENDPEYPAFVLAAQQKCITESTFFTTFDTYGEFDGAPFNVGDIYRITQDAESAEKTYVKVSAIGPSSVTLIFNSETDTLDKVVTFEESDHTSLGNFLKTAICSSTYDEYFTSVSGKDSTVNLGFKWFKETITIVDGDDADTEPEAYKRYSESLNVNLNYPTLLYYFNGTKEYKYIQNDGDEEQTKTSKIIIKKMVDEDTDCDLNTNTTDDTTDYNVIACDFDADTIAAFPNCAVEIDEDAYKIRAYNKKVISLTPDATCKLMTSGGI